MSEIRDKLIKQALEIMHEKEEDLVGQETNVWLERKIERILSIPELAIVDRDAKLPPENNKCALWDLYQKGWLESQQNMRLADYVKEVKDAT